MKCEKRWRLVGPAENARAKTQTIPAEERVNNFNEVDLALTEEEAMAEAERCLRCGICSECLECLSACERGAINHDMKDSYPRFDGGHDRAGNRFQGF